MLRIAQKVNVNCNVKKRKIVALQTTMSFDFWKGIIIKID